ncbi:MAG: apolipoprotein N-acyltransferase [Gammaproteobacteria bacterium]|nr:apolipoprotein N-acyltransferase [Gammaproteobacteria bacterium]
MIPGKSLLALLAGAAGPAAFAPLGWWPVGLLSTAILFGLWLNSARTAAAWYGFLYALGLFGVGTSWTYVSLHAFGGMPPVLAGLCVFLLVLAVSLFPAAAGFVQGVGFDKNRGRRAAVARAVLVMPGVWVAVEWLRGWLFTGFPWLTTGYAMLDTPLAGWAPVGGVYLVGGLALMTAGAWAALLLGRSRTAGAAALLTGLGWVGGWQLSAVPWTQAQGEAISVAIIQNNVPLMLKWDSGHSERIIAEYLEASARHRDADLVLWPEAAVPDYLDRLPAAFHRRLREHPADFVFGVLTRRRTDSASADGDGQWQYFNSIAVAGRRPDPGAYHKQHLVPFGEFLPIGWLFGPVVRLLDIPMSDFTAWPRPQRPLRAAGNALAASICYEDAFPQEWRAQVPDSGLLVNLSEDTWFGDSLAPHQRLQMARFRSLESGRAMLRSSNNGLSSVINWRGGIDAIAPQFVKAAVTAEVVPRTGVTPYVEHGNRLALVLAAALSVLGWLFARRAPG